MTLAPHTLDWPLGSPSCIHSLLIILLLCAFSKLHLVAHAIIGSVRYLGLLPPASKHASCIDSVPTTASLLSCQSAHYRPLVIESKIPRLKWPFSP